MTAITERKLFPKGIAFRWLAILLLVSLITIQRINAQRNATNVAATQTLLNQASIKLKQNKPEDAINLLLKIKFNPVSKEEQVIAYSVHFVMGDSYSELNNQKAQALAHFLEAKKWAEKLKDVVKLGEVYHKIGVCSIDLGKAEDARKAFNTALAFKAQSKTKDLISEAWDYNGLGNSFLYTHNLDKALENYKKALSRGIASGKYSPETATFSLSIAIVNASKGDYDNAIAYFKNTLDIFKHLYGEKSPANTQVYLNLGVCYFQKGEPDKALDYSSRAENILKNDPNQKEKLGIVYLNKGNIAIYQKDYVKALTYCQQALKILKEYYPVTHSTINAIYVNLGIIYENQEKYEDAISSLMTARANDRNSPLSIKIDRNIAGIYDKLGKSAEAEKYYLSSIKKAKALKDVDQEMGLSMHLYGKFLVSHKRNGLPYLNDALKIFSKYFSNKSQEVGFIYSSIGSYYKNINRDYSSALIYFQKALISIDETFSNQDILKTPDVRKVYPTFVYFDILQYKAITLMNLYLKDHKRTDLLKAAMYSGEQAMVMLDNIRDGYVSDESKLAIRDKSQKMSLVLMNIVAELYKKEHNSQYIKDAFRFSEKSRSAVMLSYLREVEARQIGKVPVALQSLERSLKIKIADYQKYIYDEKQLQAPNKVKIDFWENKLFQYNGKHDSLIKIIENKYPAYYSLKYDNHVIDLSEVVSNLTKKQAFLEYYINDSVLFSIMVTKDKQRVLKIPMTDEIRNQINILRNQLTKVDPTKISSANYNLFVRATRELYNVLIEPFKKDITGKDLIIVPDGELLYIPFDVLLTENPKSNGLDFRSLPYLIKDHAINYSLSATIFFGRKEKHEKQASDLAAFAPAYDKNYQYKNLVYGRKDSVMTLFPIPGALEEVNRVSQIYKGKVIKGEQASEATFKKEAPFYNILHLSAHTIIDNENPMYSKLVFTPGIDKNGTEDGLLNTFELFNMNLHAELAILSACNTGYGKLQLGEGIISISRGFFYAGVPSVVMTLWSVEDNSSAQLMELFYKHLSEGLPKDEALRQAKLDYLRQSDQLSAYPYFWAGYVNIGDNSPLEISQKRYLNYLLLASAIVLVLASVYLIFRKRKKDRARS